MVALKKPSPGAKPAVKRGPAAVPPKAKPAPVGPASTVTAQAAVGLAAKTPAVKRRGTSASAAAASAERADKKKKPKLVRDSFTMPEQEYAVLGQVKKACIKAGFEIKKSELLRIGVALISQLDLATLKNVLGSLPQLKTGRPKNDLCHGHDMPLSRP